MKRTILSKFVPAVIVALTFSSCHHKDLCYLHSHNTKIKVVYDWSNEPDANPAGMCAFFYKADNSKSNRFDFPGAKGGEIELPAGIYKIITYNNDTEAVQMSATDNFDNHRAFTRTGDILEPMYGNGVTSTARADNDERVVITPDQLWGCSVTDITITEHGESYVHESSGSRDGSDSDNESDSGDQIITLKPHDMLCHYSYEVRNVKNIRHISSISGAISGMAGAMNLSTEELDTEPVTLPVGARTNVADNTVTGNFLTFGHNQANSKPHKMSFYVVMDDGSKYSFKNAANLDVTQQVDNAPDRRHVHIIIDGLDVPEPGETGEGFNPSIDDWGVIEEDINI